MTLSESLIKSRNIPVLYLASQLQHPTFYEFLQRANITKLQSFPHYGLTMALGSVEVTMEELVKLYAMLANLGVYQNINKIVDNRPKSAIRLLSREASYLTLDILKDIGQPGFNYSMANLNSKLPVYWKTGTSSSFRDSWAIGIFGKYVLAVWVGDFRGNTRGTFVGVKTAAPLFFNIINAIIDKKATEDLLLDKFRELKITKVAVCADSGEANNNLCLVKASTWFIPGVSPIKLIGRYRTTLLSTTSNYFPSELPASTPGNKIASSYLKDLPAYNTKDPSNISLGNKEDNQSLAVNYKKLEITSPLKNVIYSLKNNKQIVLAANTDPRSNEIFWFVDNQLIGRSTPNQPLLWTAKPGKMVLRAVDNNGASDTQLIITSY